MAKKNNYNHKEIEKKWQNEWEKRKLFSQSDLSITKKKFYNLWMFPYPSAEGLHAGHAFASTGSDVYGRYMRMQGKTVFQPIGYDSFGIHSENYAIKIGDTPQNMLSRTTEHYEKQLRSLGHAYDWARTVTTSDVEYYKWTQWLFLQLFKSGLAYRKIALVNWCPSCKTVLSDEQVMSPKQAGKEPKDAQGKIIENYEDILICERCGTVVEKKDLEQWFLRITDYADKLLGNLSRIDWPQMIKVAQTNWIGKKEGITIKYPISDYQSSVECWTSRPDTNFGATFIVVSPEYAKEKLLKLISKDLLSNVKDYIKKSLSKSKDDRITEGRKKTGVFTGLYAINQLNDYKMPIWVADFVLADVGTGAVVGVPGHDKRDFEFAEEFGLEIKRVVVGSDSDESEITRVEQVQEEEGTMINSEFLNGLDIHKATTKMMVYLEDKGWGKRSTNYHLRDWLISRQRYWGAPIPMIYCDKCAKDGKGWIKKNQLSDNPATANREPKTDIRILHHDQSDWKPAGWWPDENLPVKLPKIEDYQPEGEGRGPLAKHPEFYNVVCPECGTVARRETDVSDTFLDSSWYHLRYPSVAAESDSSLPFDPVITKKWLPVDLYFGGAEHSVLHLMYARFVGMFFHDLGLIDWEEPYPRFYAHGLVIKDGAKMSKSRGNVVNPDEYIEKYGADTLRLYLMFMGPMDGYPDFRDTGIEGMRRFVERLWNLFAEYKNLVVVEEKDASEILVKMHQTVKKVGEDIQKFRYNTAISSIMEYVNLLRDKARLSNVESHLSVNTEPENPELKTDNRKRCVEWDEALKTLSLLLNPFTPHLTEEVWHTHLGYKTTIQNESWPGFDENLTFEKDVTIAVQVNGKLRGTLSVSSDTGTDEEIVRSRAQELDNVKKWLDEKTIKEIIFVPGRLINFVI
jgi:leucyl-tRNA synthetase